MSNCDDDFPTKTSGLEQYVEIPSVQLVFTSYPTADHAGIKLSVTPVVIGTSPECDLVLNDQEVSRRHCEIKITPKGIHVKDLGSKNGTKIDSVRIVEAYLTPSAALTVGRTHLAAQVVGAPSTIALSPSERFGEALGKSMPMRALFAELERLAATSATIMLFGESGTGKELLAQAIHNASPRKRGPFIVFDCSAVQANLIDAELFGYVRGAFTGAISARPGLFEQANGGTLFIDELGELALDLQPKLLRALETRKIRRLGSTEWQPLDIRIIAATHRDLRQRVMEGSFREDLYHRMSVVSFIIPPLRDRPEDIPLLVEQFLSAEGSSLAEVPPNVMQLLTSHRWPGNVRELRNTVTRLVLLPHLGKNAIVPPIPEGVTAGFGISPFLGLPFQKAKDLVHEQFERTYVMAKLSEHGRNITQTATAMGISRQALYNIMNRLGIKHDEL